MSYARVRTLLLGALAPLVLVACADQSLVGPLATPQDGQYANIEARAAEGTLYQLSVYATTFGTGAVLDAYVLDAFGAPATSGSAVFYYCSLHGNPAPSETCLTGGGHWIRYGSAGIIGSGPNQGHALMSFTESQPSGTTIGYRFKFSGQGSGIASAPGDNVADYTWP